MEYPSISSSTSAVQWNLLPTSNIPSPWNGISNADMLTAIDEIPSIPCNEIQNDFASIPDPPQWTCPQDQTPVTAPPNLEVTSNLPTSSNNIQSSSIQHLPSSSRQSTQEIRSWESASSSVVVPIQPVDSSVNKKYPCPLCKYCGNSKAALGSHQRKHGKYYVCRLCPSDSARPQFQDMSAVGSHFGQTHKNIAKKRTRQYIDIRFKEQIRIQMPPAVPSVTLPPPPTIILKTELDVPADKLEMLPSSTEEESSLFHRWFLGDDEHLSSLCNKKFDEFRNVELNKMKIENDLLNMKVASLESRLKEKEALLAEVVWNMQNIANVIEEVGGLFLFRKLNCIGNNSNIPSRPMLDQGAVEQRQPIYDVEEEDSPNKRPRTG